MSQRSMSSESLEGAESPATSPHDDSSPEDDDDDNDHGRPDDDEDDPSDRSRKAPITMKTITTTTTLVRKSKASGGDQKDKEPEKEMSCQAKCCQVLRSIGATIAMIILTCVYSVAGAFLFLHLEGPYEKNVRVNVQKNLETSVDSLWNVTLLLNENNEQVWRSYVTLELRRYQKMVYQFTERGWDGNDNIKEASAWHFSSALLYSLTVITTIGYGNITPKTEMGRYLTIVYAIFGIPMCVLMLSLIGSGMATAFRFLYKTLCNLSCAECLTLNKDGQVRVPLLLSVLVIMVYILLGAALFSRYEENWKMSEAAYFCFITLATIGFGDYVPGFGEISGNLKALVTGMYLLFGLAMLAMCFDLMREEVEIICKDIAGLLKSTFLPEERVDVSKYKKGTRRDSNLNAVVLDLSLDQKLPKRRPRQTLWSPHQSSGLQLFEEGPRL